MGANYSAFGGAGNTSDTRGFGASIGGCHFRKSDFPDTDVYIPNAFTMGRISALLIIPAYLSNATRRLIEDYLIDKFSPSIDNPYSGVSFDTATTAKANLHTHTICSDAEQYGNTPQTPVNLTNMYADYGYDILAITDHDTYDDGHLNETVHAPWVHKPFPTFPLSDYPNIGEDPPIPTPETAGGLIEQYNGMGSNADKTIMLVTGTELTHRTWYRHHFVVLLSDLWSVADVAAGYITEAPIDNIVGTPQGYICSPGVNSTCDDTNWMIQAAQDRGGLTIFAHPGYHNVIHAGQPGYDQNNYAFYVNKYLVHSNILGQEVFNGYNQYFLDDRAAWDAVLVQLMPGRKVWGFSVTDDHMMNSACGQKMDMLFVDSLTPANIISALQNGSFYGVHDPLGHTISRHTSNPPAFPTINSINVDNNSHKITISANNSNAINWIYDQQVISTGAVFDASLYRDMNYIRAELFGADGSIAFTQPFGLIIE